MHTVCRKLEQAEELHCRISITEEDVHVEGWRVSPLKHTLDAAPCVSSRRTKNRPRVRDVRNSEGPAGRGSVGPSGYKKPVQREARWRRPAGINAQLLTFRGFKHG